MTSAALSSKPRIVAHTAIHAEECAGGQVEKMSSMQHAVMTASLQESCG